MSRSSAERRAVGPEQGPGRGQVEPLAALAAVFAVTIGFGLYAGTLQAAVPEPSATDLSPTVLDAVAGAASHPTGVVVPARLSDALAAAPDDTSVNATLTAARRRWHAGPPVPVNATDRAGRRVSVETGTATSRIALGRLRVVVW